MEKFDARLEVERLKETMRDRAGKIPKVPVISLVIGASIVVFILTICVLTLVGQHHRKDIGRRRAHHTDPQLTQSILLSKLAARNNAVLEPPETSLSDIFISVKTSKKFHKSRLSVVLATWFNQARSSTFFFTDEADPETKKLAGGHLVETRCASDHSRQALCCKMQAELELFLRSEKSWFCHFDDDQYVNVAALESKLRQFDERKDWYLGKPSIGKPLDILDRDDPDTQKRVSFWFATGGAGFCLSKSLTEKMRKLLATQGRFTEVGDRMRLPDDVTMGYVVEALAKVPLTKVDEFHSHLEPLRLVNDFHNQISFSYSTYGDTGEKNIVSVDGFSEEEDPTRFLSLHCHLNLHLSQCQSLRRR